VSRSDLDSDQKVKARTVLLKRLPDKYLHSLFASYVSSNFVRTRVRCTSCMLKQRTQVYKVRALLLQRPGSD
jgi:hypothetical protein